MTWTATVSWILLGRHCRSGYRSLTSTIVAAIQKQAAEFIHMSGTDFYYENMVQLAEKLAALTPGAFRGESISATPRRIPKRAIKLARYHTGRDKFIAFLGSFHGRTMGALSLTGSKSYSDGLPPATTRSSHPLRQLLSLRLR